MVAKIGALVGRSLLFAAAEKSGKSTIQAQVAAAISRGGGVLGGPTIPGKVVWLGLEEHVGDVVRRFETLDADPDNIVVVTEVQGIAGLAEILSNGDFVYAAVDTLVEFASGAVTDPFSSAQSQPLIQRRTSPDPPLEARVYRGRTADRGQCARRWPSKQRGRDRDA
jgi:hypothetical protein